MRTLKFWLHFFNLDITNWFTYIGTPLFSICFYYGKGFFTIRFNCIPTYWNAKRFHTTLNKYKYEFAKTFFFYKFLKRYGLFHKIS